MNQYDSADPAREPREPARVMTDPADERLEKDDPAEIQAEIAQTRAQMSVTIDAIQELS